ncbi:hypothetical protein AB0J35_57990 [Nonomuraea angiospora]|uniref:hypothetical protein n=1 Tax=Nonomuraea angiospora TaxID=46172 RepID=UPI0034162698
MTHTTDPPVNSARHDQRGSSLTTAAQSFDWTRQLPPHLRGLVTTWLEIGDDAFRHVSIVPTPAGGAR